MIAPRKAWDPIDLLEALYELEQPREHWYRGAIEAVGRGLDRGRGVGMLLYDISGPEPRIDKLDGFNVSPEHVRVGTTIHAQPGFAEGLLAGYRNVVCAALDEHVPEEVRGALRDLYRPLDIHDQIFINGSNPSGLGCALYVFSAAAVNLRPSERTLLTRIATHLATAYRLQRRLDPTLPADSGEVMAAVLRADGRLEHAESAAKAPEARRVLTDAVKSREWARTRAGRSNPERATGAWTPLVATRWSLVDAYERDGRRYVTACENAPAPVSLEALSPRELQVVSLAEHGRTNKVIAYELGLVDSTVRVLMARAASKLMVRTRSELLAKFQELQQEARRTGEA